MQSVTVQLPDHVYQRLTAAAQASQKPLDDLVLQSIEAGLPPDLSHVPKRFQADLRQMDQMSDALLQQLLTTDLDPEKIKQYETLLEKNQMGNLTTKEQKALTLLREEADLLMFRRAYAAALLKWRGHIVPVSAPSQ